MRAFARPPSPPTISAGVGQEVTVRADPAPCVVLRNITTLDGSSTRTAALEGADEQQQGAAQAQNQAPPNGA
jgi:hypothetical protein